VSYVLNDVPGRTITPETRELVLRKAEELGHVPFAPGRSLRLGHSNIVLVLVRDFTLGHVASSFLDRLDAALAARDHVVLLDRYDPELRSTAQLWQLVSPALVIGMSGLSLTEQSTLELESERFLSLQGTIPNVRIGREQVEYLHRKGHEAIGYAQSISRSSEIIATERLHGVRIGCHESGMPDPDVRVVDQLDPDSVDAAVKHWLAAPGVTAVAAQSDEIALLICESLKARGKVPGKDLAVIGVDDIPAARFTLTTVGIDVDRWSTAAIATVQALLADRPAPAMPDDIIRLVERRSA
jgi:DNA-binding LacI/PurR family transcriptional regulator